MALEGIAPRTATTTSTTLPSTTCCTLCRVSGFRTENYSDVLPSDAEMARRLWDQVHADAMNTAASDPVPTAMDLKMQTTAEFEDMALQQSAARDRVDDRRGARAPRTRPACQGPHAGAAPAGPRGAVIV